jgi:uncharacterized protein (TIGR03083 family)
MSDRAAMYEQLRKEISEFVSGLDPAELDKPVPATPGWKVKDVIRHLAADATCVVSGDFPAEFFSALGDESAIGVLNNWTGRQVEERDGRSLQELLDEWTVSGDKLIAMMRDEEPWPEGMLFFADRILVTDTAVHQQDIFGALGVKRNRDGPHINFAIRTYSAGVSLRLATTDLSPLCIDFGEDSYTHGDGEPGATVRATPFELFRALSGRRNPEQIAAFEWEGDANAYIPYFYPYGMRRDALVE